MYNNLKKYQIKNTEMIVVYLFNMCLYKKKRVLTFIEIPKEMNCISTNISKTNFQIVYIILL